MDVAVKARAADATWLGEYQLRKKESRGAGCGFLVTMILKKALSISIVLAVCFRL